MKLLSKNVAMRWLFVNIFVMVIMFGCAYSAAKTVEEKTPDIFVEQVQAETLYESPKTLKTGRNPGFVEDYELPVEYSNVERVEYFNVPLDYDLQDYIFELCESYDVDPSIIIAMIWKESTYREETVGDGGNSLGLMQIQPRWHQARMDRLGVLFLMNPFQNVRVGIDYFAELMANGRGLEWSLMAYNGGYSYAHRLVARGEVSYYASRVIEKAAELTTNKIIVERVVNR